MSRECPFCGTLCSVSETTSYRQRSVGLCYLQIKCPHCGSRIDAAGIGENEAFIDLDRKIEARFDTKPEHWTINQTRKKRWG